MERHGTPMGWLVRPCPGVSVWKTQLSSYPCPLYTPALPLRLLFIRSYRVKAVDEGESLRRWPPADSSPTPPDGSASGGENKWTPPGNLSLFHDAEQDVILSGSSRSWDKAEGSPDNFGERRNRSFIPSIFSCPSATDALARLINSMLNSNRLLKSACNSGAKDMFFTRRETGIIPRYTSWMQCKWSYWTWTLISVKENCSFMGNNFPSVPSSNMTYKVM